MATSKGTDRIDGIFDVDSISDNRQWVIMGKQFPRSEVKFFAQILIIYLVIVTCLVNLSLGKSNLNSLWISMLSTAVGVILPTPSMQKSHKVPAAVTAPAISADVSLMSHRPENQSTVLSN